MRSLAGLTSRQRLILGAAATGAIVVLVAVVLLLVIGGTDAADEQPIAFNHQVHVVQNEMQCQFCHSGVASSPVAGIPSVEKCMGCHEHIAVESPEIQKLAEYWANNEPIPWVRVNYQPDYVYFAHHTHVAAGVTCGACHGDVANMTVAEQVVEMNMGFCLDCHADQEGGKEVLWDCAVCHR